MTVILTVSEIELDNIDKKYKFNINFDSVVDTGIGISLILILKLAGYFATHYRQGF